MFRPTNEAPLLTEAGVRGLCASLNSPVLNLDQLPVGPARATLLLYAGEYGGLQIAVGIRSVETGAVTFFVYRGAADDFTDPARALDAALAFAEGLGFLFDDELVERVGQAEALRIWQERTGELEDAAPPVVEEQAELELETDTDLVGELMLDEFAAGDGEDFGDDDIHIDLEVMPEPALASDRGESPSVPPPPAAVRPQAAAAPPALTKFRRPETDTREQPAAAGSGDPAGNANALGRISLVRRRLNPDPTVSDRPGLLMRILSGF